MSRISRRDLLYAGAATAALVAVPALGRACPARRTAVRARPSVDEELEALLSRVAVLGATAIEDDAAFTAWQQEHRRLVRSAEQLRRLHSGRAAAWYVAARYWWTDVDGDLEEQRALRCARQAIGLDAGHVPAYVAAQNIASFLGLVHNDEALLDEAVRCAEQVVVLTGGHAGARANLHHERAERALVLGGPGFGTTGWTKGKRAAWVLLEQEIRARCWDGVRIDVLPLVA